MPQPLSRIVNQLKSEPSRTGSLIITVFGDAIVPRGGSVWLGSLLAFFEGLAIDGSVVRTAMSRLTAEGWFERSKSGRHSFYRLTRRGEQTFAGATRHIYDSPPAEWNGSFELLLLGSADDREQARTVLRDAGFGSPLPGVFVAPSSIAVPDAVEGAIR
ncbi:MAG: phenylacetic acid degradation operon negative regulatory protein PaaX, partial [Bradyrhizobium sp.]|nr:phenylacetic acid degradation operon negative regulatory protein PaaX [Bradyrhizobium sp.]